MPASDYRLSWEELQHRPDALPQVRVLALQVAYSFLDAYLRDGHYEVDYIALLSEMTTNQEQPGYAHQAANALFGVIIERLCDDFEDIQTRTYNQVLSQVISFCRAIPGDNSLDQQLHAFGLHTEDDIVQRIETLRNQRTAIACDLSVKKILILSRVTIGADIAVTSVIVQRLANAYPGAEIVLLGPAKLAEIYAGNPRLRLRPLNYQRRGGLLERLSVWHEVLSMIDDEQQGLAPESMLVIDPDSRLSQLGVLPLCDDAHYYFFDSRSQESKENHLSMAQMANAWADLLTGRQAFQYPKIWPLEALLATGRQLIDSLRKAGAKRIIVMNFGVGGNPRKRVGIGLETELMREVLVTPNTVVLLDKGFGEEELSQTEVLLSTASLAGYATQHTHFADHDFSPLSWGVIGIQCSVGEIATLIAESDEYIGYDSACQHLAAALGTPCLTLFAGSNNSRFIRRWSPFGSGPSRIIHIDTLTNPAAVDVEGIMGRLRHARQQLLR